MLRRRGVWTNDELCERLNVAIDDMDFAIGRGCPLKRERVNYYDKKKKLHVDRYAESEDSFQIRQKRWLETKVRFREMCVRALENEQHRKSGY